MPKYEFVTYEMSEHIGTIVLNRPEAMNSVHPAMHAELVQVWTQFANDTDAWVAIVTGAGDKAFCAGNDLKTIGPALPDDATASPLPAGGFGAITFDFACDKPIIAAVNGYALGGGFEIALACDLIVASGNAVFALPEPRVGTVAGSGGIHRLSRKIALNQAAALILTGGRLSAGEALKLGLVNEVVPRDGLMSSARRWAAEILECSPFAVRASKQMLNESPGKTASDAIRADLANVVPRVLASTDYFEGAQAFVEKRRPRWSGQ